MRQVSEELLAHFSSEVQTLATCWQLTRRDGEQMRFTDHDVVVEFDGNSYEPSSGFVNAENNYSAELVADVSQIDGLLKSDAISEQDILSGVYDHAEVEIFMVNYKDQSQGKMILRVGWFGEVLVSEGEFTVQMSGLSQRLGKTIGQLYSPSCRANLGDEKCTIDVSALMVVGAVEAVSDRRKFADSNRGEASGYFNYGIVKFTSGANVGLSMEIKSFQSGEVGLMLPMPHDIAVGDGYEMISGCDKEFSTCKTQYDNVVNFRGEPQVPGYDAILKTSGTL